MGVPALAREVLAFWFADGHTPHWFARSTGFDAQIRTRFAAAVDAASAGQLDDWVHTPEGWLALLIMLDQFRRNLYRDDARAWACDGQALTLALAGIERGDDQRLPPLQRVFAYMPLEHAENLVLQHRCVALFAALCTVAGLDPEQRILLESFLDYARRHQRVIERFGRFPHRNALLGRSGTSAELAYLALPGAGF
ncbi:MAG TPA: DUF924 family protein [Rhodanobacter sp.]|jgi:uncharacterized protein (DUF924 family)